MNDRTPPVEQAQIVSFAGQLIQKTSKIHLNLGQEFILTTDDKIRLCLNKHLSRMDKRKAWITPFGILLTILIVFPTTTFRPFVCSAETWEAMFVISGLISFGWLISSIWQARVSTSIDHLVADIKQTAIAHEASQSIDVPGTEPKVGLSASVAQGELTILSAVYGAEGKTKDVTQLVRSKVSKGRLEIHVCNDEIGGDPIPGVVKELKVIYSCAGQRHSITIDEGEVLLLP